jgi:transcriptional regulator with XRE-family HTH domain
MHYTSDLTGRICEDMEWYEKLAKRRKERGFSQAQVGRILNLSQQGYGHIESEKGDPKLSQLLMLRDLLGFSLDDLFDDGVEDVSNIDLVVIRDAIKTIGIPEAKRRLLDAQGIHPPTVTQSPPPAAPPRTTAADVTEQMPTEPESPSAKKKPGKTG